MNKRQRIEQIFELLAKIPVAGESVDIMAAVRQELRITHKAILAEESAAREKANATNDREEENDG